MLYASSTMNTMKKKLAVLLGIVAILVDTSSVFAVGQDWTLLFSLRTNQASGAFSYPTGLYVDTQAQRYYVTDSGRDRLVSFDREGKLLHSFTAGGTLDKPIAMAKKGDGRLLVLEKGKASLTEIDVKSRAVVPHALVEKGEPLFPQRLKAVDENFYIIDKASGAIVILDQSLAVIGRLKCPDCQAGYADFSAKGGLVYALPMLGSEIHVFSKGKELTSKISLDPAPDFPISLALAPDGGFFVLERHSGTVTRYHANGQLLSRHLAQGHKEGSLSYPVEIQVDPWGRVCVVDEGNGRVSVFQP